MWAIDLVDFLKRIEMVYMSNRFGRFFEMYRNGVYEQ